MRRAWRLSSDAVQSAKWLVWCFHKTPARLSFQAQLIHESSSQRLSTSALSQFKGWAFSSLFQNKLNSKDSAANRDLMDKVTPLRDELLKCRGNMEDVGRVLETKGAPLFRNYHDGSAVVKLLKQLDQTPDLALQVLNWRREQMDWQAPMTVEEYSRGISLAGKLQNVDLAEELFTEASNKKLKETSLYNALMGACMCNGMAAKCQSVFRDLKQDAICRPTIVSYNILISVFGRLLMVDHMESILQEIKDVDISPNVRTYNNLIAGYVTAWMWASMETTFTIMKATDVKPDMTTYLLILRGYALSGRLDKMEEIYQMVKDHVNSKDFSLIRTMICAYSRSSDSNRVERIEELLMLIPEAEYRPWLHVLLICVYANKDLFEEMENSISKAFERKTTVKTTAIMRCIAASYFRQNAVDKFADFVSRAESAGWKTCRSLYHCKMVMYAAQRRLSDMEKVVEEMDQANLYISKKTCWILYKAYSQWGEISKVEQVKGIMLKLGYGIPVSS